MQASNQTLTQPSANGLAVFFAIVAFITVVNSLCIEASRQITELTVLWPAAGIVLAALMLFPRHQRHIVLGYYVGMAVSDALLRVSFGETIVMPAIACARLLLANYLILVATGGRPDFRHWRPTLMFTCATVIAASVTGLAGSEYEAMVAHTAFWKFWFSWCVSGSLSFAVFTPPLMLLADRIPLGGPPIRWGRIGASCLLNAATVLIAFGQNVLPVKYLVPCALIWTSLAAGLEATVLSLLIDVVILLSMTALGFDSTQFAPGTVALRLATAQIYSALISFAILPAAAAIAEREQLRFELVRMVSRLRKSETEFRLMAEKAQDIVLRSDQSGRIKYISPAIRSIAGYEPSELVGQSMLALLMPEDVDSIRETLGTALKNGYDTAATYRIRHKQGREIWVECHPSYIDDADGNRGILDVLRDVSQRKELETALMEARDRAETAAAAKAEFLSNMSHELRTPLTSVLGFADILNELPEIGDRAKGFVGRIRSAGQALLATINDVLDYSKLESGQFELIPETVEVREHAARVIEVLTVQANAKGIDLCFDCAPNLPGKPGLLDPHRLRQVILNLVGNAIKFTDQGRVKLAVSSVDRAAQTYLRYEISDTGTGIPGDRLEMLFQRFSQVDTSSSRRHHGTGLGLAICKAIVEAMGGEIGVSSIVGKGSLFWFEIPFRECRGLTPVETESENQVDNASVLIVDDNAANRTLVRIALARVGIEADEAASGREAIALCAGHAYGAILMDLHMPHMDGEGAMHEIRRSSGLSATAPIFAFTAEGEETRLAGLKQCGFDGVITKPLNVSQLQATVIAALRTTRSLREDERHVA